MGPTMICVFNLFNSFFLVIGLSFSLLGVLLAFFPGILWAKLYAAVEENAVAGYTIPSSAEEFGSVSIFTYLGLASLGLGGLMAIASLMAFVGARCAQKCCKKILIVYAVLVSILLVIESTVGVMLYLKDSPLHDQAKSMLQSLIDEAYAEDGTDSFSMSLNAVHRYYDCCGMDNADDFGDKEHASCDANDESKGCYAKLQSFFHTDLFPVGLAAFCILQAIGVYCAVSLYKHGGGIAVKSDNKVRPLKPAVVDVMHIPGARATTDLY